MANIWKQNKDVSQHPNRNNFDLSYVNHSTFKFGYLYPVFCKLSYPGDSFRIDSAFDLKLMPLVFPVQSRMRAHLHFFYVRHKNLWSDWEDWISGLKSSKQAVPPYILPPDAKVEKGSIYDFLGTPTSLVTGVPVVERSSFDFSEVSPFVYSSTVAASDVGRVISFYGSYSSSHPYPRFKFKQPVDYIAREYVLPSALNYQSYYESFHASRATLLVLDSEDKLLLFITEGVYADFSTGEPPVRMKFTLSDSVLHDLQVYHDSHPDVGLYFVFGYFNSDSSIRPPAAEFLVDPTHAYFQWDAVSAAGFYQYSDLDLRYYQNVQPLFALPFRAYESIYYAYYANSVLQPLVVNGQKEFNKFNHTTASGLDTTDYHLFKRNYELDYLTSGLPSPQMGNAPLVGMSALGDITIEDENGITTGKAVLDSDGNVTKIQVTSPLASVDHARTMMNIASVGMNINDFRSTNALQRFLEQTLRSGYRYMDFVRGHWGKEPEYRELDMPEFIGGYSRDVAINTVVSMADTLGISGDGGSELGQFVGNGRVVGGSNHSISHYCDDYGYIIGILSVTPTPAYSQLLSRHLIVPKNNLDFAFPEFSRLGLQPVTYREVMPLQAYIDSIKDPTKRVDDVFCYQRPNYDLVSSVDEVHGEFRGSLRNFLVNRIFDGRPELGDEFLQINPDEVNDIFANTNPDDDTIIGQIAFRVHSKRPFPRVHIPGLGL